MALLTPLLTAEPLADDASQSSMTSRILVLDTAAQTHNSYIPMAIVDALRRHHTVAAVRLAGYGDAVEVFHRERCDTFLALGGAGCDLAIVARLCAMAARSAIWITEDPYELEENLRVSRPFDLAFTNDLSCLPAYGRRGRHLPLAASTAFHDIAPVTDETTFLYDVCFVGTAWPNRVKTINHLIGSINRPLRMKIGLPGNPHLPPAVLSDRSLSTDWRVPNPELARIVNRSRVTLNLERKYSSARTDQTGGSTPPPRLFENALAGAFQISLSTGTEAALYFDPATEVPICDSETSLIARIVWALDNPGDRILMAQAAQNRARHEHLYDHRLNVLLSELQTKRPAVDTPRVPRLPAPNRRKRLLLVTHNVSGQRPGGGVEVYQQEIAAGLTDFDVFTLFPTSADGLTTYTLISNDTDERHRYGVPHGVGFDTLHDAGHERVFEQVLIENRIDIVHFQHLLGMPLSLPLVAKACGVPTVYTLHDFYLTCSRFNLIDYRGRFCDTARRSPTECDVCLGAGGIPAGAQQRRRNFVAGVINTLDTIVVSSAYSADHLRAIYPDVLAERIHIVEMLTPPTYRLPIAPPAGRVAALRVAVPGNFTHAKGAETIIRVMCLLKDDPVDFFILGTIQDRGLADHLRALALPRVTIHGGYVPSEMPRLMAGMDVSLHLSIWPETYMISLNEAWDSGAVPIVSDLGAPGERVRDGTDGFKVDPGDAGRVCDLIRELAGDRSYLEDLRQATAARTSVSASEHIGRLTTLYDKLLVRQPVQHAAILMRAERDYILNARACGIRTNTPEWSREGNGWDEAAAPGPCIEPAPRIDALWRTFPPRFAHLARQSVASGLGSVQIERLAVTPRPARGGGVSTRRGVEVTGWAFVPERGRPLDVILHVIGGQQEVYAVCSSRSRQDVSMHLGMAEAEMSGFVFDIDVSELRADRYAIRLFQVYDGTVMDFGIVDEVATIDHDTTPLKEMPAPVLDLGDLQWADGEAAITLADTAYKSNGTRMLVLEGYAFDRGHRRVLPDVHVGFVRGGGTPVWFPAERIRATASLAAEDPLFTFAGLRAVIGQSALESGLHRVVVAEAGLGAALLHETGAAVMVLSDRVLIDHPIRDAAPGERVAATCRALPMDRDGPIHGHGAGVFEHRLQLEQVETDAGDPGGGRLYLRGWAYVPNLGRAESLALHILGQHHCLRAVLPAVQRWDVAEHLGADAAWAGFEALVTLGDLPSGQYRAELSYACANETAALPLNLDLAVPRAA